VYEKKRENMYFTKLGERKREIRKYKVKETWEGVDICLNYLAWIPWKKNQDNKAREHI
jgi:hypothetical protein